MPLMLYTHNTYTTARIHIQIYTEHNQCNDELQWTHEHTSL